MNVIIILILIEMILATLVAIAVVIVSARADKRNSKNDRLKLDTD